MNFLNPYLLGLLAFLPLIVLMYLLKLKRRRVVLPSTLLWKRTLEDMIANRPFQRLRNNILLWIQLLVMTLAALAAARPFLNLAGFQGDAVVVIIDNSASMQATDVLPSRLERAKEEAARMIRDLSRGDRMMLMTLNRSSQVVQPFTADKDLLRRGLRAIGPTDMTSSAEEAARILESVVKTERNPQVFLLSDGRVSHVDKLLNMDALRGRVKFLVLGAEGRNAGFTQLDVRPDYEKAGRFEIFATLENFGDTPVSDVVEFYFNDQLADARQVTLEPGGAHNIVFDAGAEGGTFRLRLPARDLLDVDNQAIGVIQAHRAFRVLLVGPGNPFLQSAFKAHPMTAVSIAAQAEYDPAADFDLVVFDGAAPAGPLTQGNYLFFNCVPPLEGFAQDGEIEFPVIVDWNPVHPVTRFIKFDKIQIGKALRLKVPPQAAALAEAQQGVMMAVIQRPDLTLLVVPFDVLQSDWPLLPSFPMFVNNVIDWLGQMRLSRGQLMTQTGGALPLRIPEDWTAGAEVLRPDGTRAEVAVTPGQVLYFAGTERAGVYLLRSRGGGGAAAGGLRFAANLISREESDVAPRPVLETPRVSVAGIKSLEPMNREIWKWLVLGALIFIMIEWFVYCRRTWV